MEFRIKAIDARDALATLTMTAATESEARERLAQQGYAILSMRRQRGFAVRRARRFPLLAFSQELVCLLDAGLNVVESIEALAERETRGDVRAVIVSVLAALRQGRPLSAAIEMHGDSFPQLYIATIRASEHTGDLSQALRRYIQYALQLDEVRRRVVSASIYPLLLLVLGALVLLFLLGYVVPRFAGVYEDVGRDVPAMSRWLLAWGRALSEHADRFAIGAVAVIAAAVLVLRRPGVRIAISTRIARLPALGERLRIMQLARFYRTVGMLLKAGIAAPAALSMSTGVAAAGQQAGLLEARRGIDEGLAVSEALHRNGLTTPVALRMLRVGEMTGDLGEMMERIAHFHEDESSRAVEILSRLFEPLLMVLIGGLIGGVVVLMYLPIFDLAGSVR